MIQNFLFRFGNSYCKLMILVGFLRLLLRFFDFTVKVAVTIHRQKCHYKVSVSSPNKASDGVHFLDNHP